MCLIRLRRETRRAGRIACNTCTWAFRDVFFRDHVLSRTYTVQSNNYINDEKRNEKLRISLDDARRVCYEENIKNIMTAQ